MASLQAGKPVALVWLLLAFALAEAVCDLLAWRKRPARMRVWRIAAKAVYPDPGRPALPAAAGAAADGGAGALTLLLVVPMGPQLYRLFYQPIAAASTLVLLIVSIAVHLALVGLGLLAFGAEGARTAPFSDAGLTLGPVNVNSQALWVVAVSALLIVVLYQFFERSMYGKALRAAAFNRLGARLMGISPVFAGRATFFLAALIGTVSGILIAPITTMYFDSGFMVSLKGFVGAIIGGLVSYPLAAAGAVLGLIEAFSRSGPAPTRKSSCSPLIIPVLLWRSLKSHHVEEEEE